MEVVKRVTLSYNDETFILTISSQVWTLNQVEFKYLNLDKFDADQKDLYDRYSSTPKLGMFHANMDGFVYTTLKKGISDRTCLDIIYAIMWKMYDGQKFSSNYVVKEATIITNDGLKSTIVDFLK